MSRNDQTNRAGESPSVVAAPTATDEFDIVVMGEGERTLLTTVLGDTCERLAEGGVAPVLVVRRDRSGDEETDG